jgi:mRNA interferase MazF
MPHDCAAKLDHIQTVSKSRIGALIAIMSPQGMHDLHRALLFALGF